MLLNLRT